MPYSVSMPQTLGMATYRPYLLSPSVPGAFGPELEQRVKLSPANDWPPGRCRPGSEVLAGAHALDRTATFGLAVLGHERAHVDDSLPLLARDPRPVVGVGRVGEVL